MGDSYNIVLSPGFGNKAQREYWRIWIDYNSNYDFEASEEVFAANNIRTDATGSFTVPLNVNAGQTRMRVSMKFASAPGPCENPFDRGEVEDYTVNILPPGSYAMMGIEDPVASEPQFSFYPNPAKEKLFMSFHGWGSGATVQVYDITGVQVMTTRVESASQELDISSLNQGIYLITVKDNHSNITRKLVIK